MSWYGLTYLAGTIALMGLLYLRQKSVIWALYYGSYLSLCTIIGGRLGYIVFYEPSFYLSHPSEILALYNGGMSFHGALIGLLLGSWLLGHKRHKTWWLLDQATWVALVMLPIGRICNFLNGEIYGTVTSPTNPFALMYVSSGELIYRHPVVLYEAAAIALIIAPILLYQARRPRFAGCTACSFALLYAVMRFILEFWREPDPTVGPLLGLNLGQWLCLIQAVLASALLKYLRPAQAPSKRRA